MNTLRMVQITKHEAKYRHVLTQIMAKCCNLHTQHILVGDGNSHLHEPFLVGDGISHLLEPFLVGDGISDLLEPFLVGDLLEPFLVGDLLEPFYEFSSNVANTRISFYYCE